jgi:NAD(P)-dependent dehydrogenase (short-subunit alcohol dehydrogenase family)
MIIQFLREFVFEVNFQRNAPPDGGRKGVEGKRRETMGRMAGKVAVVTGGARGIGKATCKVLAAEGARVAVTDIVDAEWRQVVADIRRQGGTAEGWHLDTSSEPEVKQVLEAVCEKFGGLHVLVNNAGIAGTDEATHEIALEDWQKVLDVNVNGVFLCTKHAVPHFRRAGGGAIINLSSIYGIIGAPDLPAYHASKGAVRLMTKTDALLYARDGIRINSVHPGYIWTPLVEDLAERSGKGVEAFRADLASRHPLGRVGDPDDIAYGILYLASDESGFVTGSELVIDGGYTAQ